MPRFTAILMALGLLTLQACTSPVVQSDAPMQSQDKDTDLSVSPRPDGFAITVNYSRYQFIPESSAVATACKSAVTASAYDQAEKIGRKIQPINEQRIRISMGRNGLTGITTCSATAIAEWAK